MKKTLTILALALMTTSFPSAATAPAVADYLGKLNLVYYSPVREGLKNYLCEVHNSYIAVYVDHYTQQYGADDKRVSQINAFKFLCGIKDGKSQSGDHYPGDTGDRGVDNDVDQVESFGNLITSNFDKSWVSPAGLPYFSPDDIAKNDYTIVKGKAGFDLVQTKDKKVSTFSFNNKSVMTQYVFTDNGKVKKTLKPLYVATPKGLLLDSITDDEPEDKFTRTLKMQYQDVQGFQLPVTVQYKEHLCNQKPDEKDFELVLTFDDFKVNQ